MKNAKTIIFGALIAAMILPFSVIPVQAQEVQNNNSSVEQIDADIRTVENLIENTQNVSEIEQLIEILLQLEILKEMIVSQNLRGYVDNQIISIFESTYSEDEKTIGENYVKKSSHRPIFERNYDFVHRTYDCQERSTISGDTDLNVKLYNNRIAIQSDFEYPEEYNKRVVERRSNTCANGEFDNAKIIFASVLPLVPVSPGEFIPRWCEISTESNNSTLSKTCPYNPQNRWNVMISTNEYELPNNKSTSLGSAVIKILQS